MQQQPYPYCPHGMYVGGCGIDYSCFTCEMGEPAPTINQLKRYMRNEYRAFTEATNPLTGARPELPLGAQAMFVKFMADAYKMAVLTYRSDIEEIKRWTDDPDDDTWIKRRYEARRALWDQESGEDQFWSLPHFVLDGP